MMPSGQAISCTASAWGDNKCPEPATDDWVGNSRPNTGIPSTVVSVFRPPPGLGTALPFFCSFLVIPRVVFYTVELAVGSYHFRT